MIRCKTCGRLFCSEDVFVTHLKYGKESHICHVCGGMRIARTTLEFSPVFNRQAGFIRRTPDKHYYQRTWTTFTCTKCGTVESATELRRRVSERMDSK